MCLTPSRLYDDEGRMTEVACRSCWQCRSNRVNDLVGRCLAEQTTSSTVLALTLTYSGDGPESAVLRYADVQSFMRYLRDDEMGNYDVRYIVAGEYGEKKGRAHWHIILFFNGAAPSLPNERRINWKYWKHGFVYPQTPDYGGFRYLLKYVLKQPDRVSSSKKLSMSKKPPLGHQFFMDLAQKYVDRGLALWSPEYYFGDLLDDKGRHRRFWLQGRMQEMFCERYVDLWFEKHGKLPPYTEFLFEQYLDPIARKELDLDPVRLEKRKALKQKQWIDSVRSAERLRRDNERQVLGICLVNRGASDLLTAYSDYTADLEIGSLKWHLEEGNAPVSAQLAQTPLLSSQRKSALLWLEKMWRNHRSQK